MSVSMSKGQTSFFSLRDYIDLTPQEQATLAMGKLSVGILLDAGDRAILRMVHDAEQCLADADVDSDSYLGSLRAGTTGWRRAFEALAEVIASRPGRAGLLGIELSTSSSLVHAGELATSKALRRLDALMDCLGTDFCAADAQAAYFACMQELDPAGAKWLSVEVLKGAKAAVGALAIFHPLLGGAASLGLDALGESRARTGTAEPVDGSEELARLIACCRYALEPVDRALAIRRARISLTSQIHETAVRLADDAERARLGQGTDALLVRERSHATLISALTQLSSMDESAPVAQDPPNVEGMRLSDARRTLAAFGVAAEAADALKPGGNLRQVWSESNWKVVSQEAVPSGAVKLGVVKYGESYRDAEYGTIQVGTEHTQRERSVWTNGLVGICPACALEVTLNPRFVLDRHQAPDGTYCSGQGARPAPEGIGKVATT